MSFCVNGVRCGIRFVVFLLVRVVWYGEFVLVFVRNSGSLYGCVGFCDVGLVFSCGFVWFG